VSAAHVRASRSRAWPVGRRTVVGRALSSRDDCSNHSALVLKYGMARFVPEGRCVRQAHPLVE
jgi:hypothetical protein